MAICYSTGQTGRGNLAFLMADRQKNIAEPAQGHFGAKLFAVVAGLFFFVVLLKFGDPVVLTHYVTPPENAAAAVFESWPLAWGYWLLAPLVVTGLVAARWKPPGFKWVLVLPSVWLFWQFISATQTVDARLTSMTLKHFSACVALFYLGYFSLQGIRNPWALWTGLALALCWIMRTGLEQHFGGLEATRRMLYSMKEGAGLPPGLLNDPAYLKRVASPRIFGTFSNPDAMAGCILLLLPVTLVFLWQLTPKVQDRARWLFVAILGGCGLACLYWTGSKGGWLIALLAGMVALGRSTVSMKLKRILICGVLLLGLVGFGVRYAASYKKQKVSVVTRFAYWEAALQIAVKHPLLGTGPGTFSVPYGQIKRPEDDFARLCHNDYLEQASDSGWLGFLTYFGMISGSLAFLYRANTGHADFSIGFALWLGIASLCVHSLVEYHLYIPALAWPMFFLLGFSINPKVYR